MKNWFSIKICKKPFHLLIYFLISCAIAGLTFLLFPGNMLTVAAIFAILFVSLSVRLSFTEKTPLWLLTLFLFIMSGVIFVLFQRTNTAGFCEVGIIKPLMNVIIVASLVFILWAICGKMKVSLITITIITQIIAVADIIVSRARSLEIQFSDMTSLGTAAQVADQYTLSVPDMTKATLVLAACFTVFLILTKFPKKERSIKQLAVSLSGIAAGVLCVIIIYTQIGAGIIDYKHKYWKVAGSMYNGFFVNFVYTAISTEVKAPEDYDAAKLDNDMSIYYENNSASEEEDKNPNVIVIMNESFADIHNIADSLGNEMKTDSPIMPFFDSLDDSDSNIVKGHALASIYGGNTANSEFEFLTGLSMQFLPRSTVAYSLYVNEDNSHSIVENFESEGYVTMGMHPEKDTNWKRNEVYENFGFDEIYFKEDFKTADGGPELLRTHPSDKAVYDKVIDLYEEHEDGAPIFSFVVTMQNHGGYTSGYSSDKVKVEGDNDPELAEYLYCVNHSDKAFEDLIDYFENVEEDTVILFFGDHQPTLTHVSKEYMGINADSTTKERQAEYVVPYVFYANFDIDVEENTEFTSLNFLSSWLLDIADVSKRPVDLFLEDIQDEIVAINSMGWFDKDLNFHETDYNEPDLNDILTQYSHVNYNILFDKNDPITELYTPIEH